MTLLHFRSRRTGTPSRRRPVRTVSRFGRALEVLDDRITPTASSITSSFNGGGVKVGDNLWFSSDIKVSGLGSAPVTVHVDHASVSSDQFNVALPDASITFSPSATAATTTFDAAHNTWLTTVPIALAGNAFLDGGALTVANKLTGGNKPLNWRANFTTDTPGVTVQWEGAAEAYKSFSTNYVALGVNPVDSSSGGKHPTSDYAGTPEAFKAFLIGNPHGVAGSNSNGSNSNGANLAGTAVAPDLYVPPASGISLSGTVFVDADHDGVMDNGETGVGGVQITLTGTDLNGNQVTLTATTAGDGTYSFQDLAPGTYSVTQSVPFFLQGTNTISGIVLKAGDVGINFNFGDFARAR